jgi:hypothetical protein
MACKAVFRNFAPALARSNGRINLRNRNGWQHQHALHRHLPSPPAGHAAIRLNGVLLGADDSVTFPMPGMEDVGNIIGAGNWHDPGMEGCIEEFRIYNGALQRQLGFFRLALILTSEGEETAFRRASFFG